MLKQWLTYWSILTEVKHHAAFSTVCPGSIYIQLPIDHQLHAHRAHSYGNNATQRLKPLRSVSLNEHKSENAEIKQETAG